MLGDLCAELRNYFVKDIYRGTFEIVDGVLAPLDFLQEGQYFRIVGSVFNDGVHQYGSASFPTDERFTGAIWTMAVPSAVIDLANEIKTFCESDEGKPTAYTSESFAGYSYSKATNSNGQPLQWQDVFAKKMNKYRRISVL